MGGEIGILPPLLYGGTKDIDIYAHVGEWTKPMVCKTIYHRWFESSHVLKNFLQDL